MDESTNITVHGEVILKPTDGRTAINVRTCLLFIVLCLIAQLGLTIGLWVLIIGMALCK